MMHKFECGCNRNITPGQLFIHYLYTVMNMKINKLYETSQNNSLNCTDLLFINYRITCNITECLYYIVK